MASSGTRRGAKVPTRSLILNEVERLIVRKGVYGFTLRDVAAPLGVQPPAIYKHFESRDDVLIELSRRFIDGLSRQFAPSRRAGADPAVVLKRRLDEFVDFHLNNPAYVRLSLIDFATPEGGMEYLSLASGGPIHETPHSGPLAVMHRHLAALLERRPRDSAVPRGDAHRFLQNREVCAVDPARLSGRRAAHRQAFAGPGCGG